MTCYRGDWVDETRRTKRGLGTKKGKRKNIELEEANHDFGLRQTRRDNNRSGQKTR